MSTSEIRRKTGVHPRTLYYLEEKGWVHPRRRIRGHLEFRDWSEQDCRLVATIWQYKEAGFVYRVAYEKALHDLGLTS